MYRSDDKTRNSRKQSETVGKQSGNSRKQSETVGKQSETVGTDKVQKKKGDPEKSRKEKIIQIDSAGNSWKQLGLGLTNCAAKNLCF